MSNRHDEWWKTRATHVDIADKNLKLKDCMDLLAPQLTPAIKKGGKILEYGCGIGRLTIPMAKHFKDILVVGYDISEKFLHHAICEAKAKKADCCFTSELYPFARYDAAYSMMVLQHLTHPAKKQMIKTIAKHLNPGALFRFQYVEGDNHSFLTHDITYKEMDKLCADAGLHAVDVEYNVLYPRWSWVTAIKGES